MDRKSAAYNKSRKGLQMAAILQFWSFKIEDSPSVNGLQKQWYGNALSVRLTITHPFTSLGPTTRAANSDILRRIQLPTMIPTSANHISRLLHRRLKGLLGFYVYGYVSIYSPLTPHTRLVSYTAIIEFLKTHTSLVKSGLSPLQKAWGLCRQDGNFVNLPMS